jgi:hypothetical protein
MGRTRDGNVWRTRHDLPESLTNELERLCRSEPIATNFRLPPISYEVVHAVLGEHAPITDEYRGPCYQFPNDLPSSSAGAVAVTSANADVLAPHFTWAIRAVGHMPIAAALVDGQAVAACWCSRLGERACEAGVETIPEHRGHGHATLAVARWATLVRESGRIPLYSTSWDNLASQGVARHLGMIFYGEDWSID